MNYSKEDAIRIVVSCAENFKKELEDRTLLFFCMDKHKNISYIEFSFFFYNFLHLTGLTPTKEFISETGSVTGRISAVRFYEKCLDHRLKTMDFEFSDQGTTPLKLDVLPLVISKNLSANMIGNFSSPHPKLYTEKIAGGTKAYIGFIKDAVSHTYVPNTVVKEDLRKNVADYVRIIAAYRKKTDDSEYSEIVYTAKKIDWDKVNFPDKFTYLQKPK
ncbi:MAG: PBECR4 domain-containing protein [Eubacterium sp.]|nr:PBECR4 domain-containing protein [Eubacterium sp.]